MRRNCLLKHVIQGKVEGRIKMTRKKEEDISSYWMTLRKIERGSTRSHLLENTF